MNFAKSESLTSSYAGERKIEAGAEDVHGNWLRQGVLLLILSIPSLYIFLSLPPLWRDADAFNEIAATFAPKGIIHFLPGYCLGGRLIVFAGSFVASLWGGHGLPQLSINAPPLTDAGISSLIVIQHLFLIFSLFYVVKTLSDHFPTRVLLALVFTLTPWLYIYANCIGTEGFSNPLVYLVAAYGWKCLRTTELNTREVALYFGLLLAAALTRQINVLLAACLPIALLPLAGKELILRGTTAKMVRDRIRLRYTRRLLVSVAVGLLVIGASLLVQQTLCWLFRVPFRSTYGQTFQYRLSYLEGLPEQERTDILAGISRKLADPVITEALQVLNGSLSQGQAWSNTFLYDKIDEILVRSGFNQKQNRTCQVDLKLNRIATCVLLSGDPKFLEVVWASFAVSPFFAQTDLASAPFELTDWLQKGLANPKYQRLRGLSSFQHEEGYYDAAFRRIQYLRLFERIPMLEMACITIALALIFGGLNLMRTSRDPAIEAGVWYAVGLIVVGFLISLATCLSTYFQARLYLPLYSLFQMGMLLGVSMAARLLLKKGQSH